MEQQRVRGAAFEREFLCSRCARWQKTAILYGKELVCQECDLPEQQQEHRMRARILSTRVESQRLRAESARWRQIGQERRKGWR